MSPLVGREGEIERIDTLIEGARDERSGVLVLRGEPGIGKSALLQQASERAGDMRVLRSVGIEAEHGLAFAGAHQLVRPCLGLVERLPGPQAAALRGAFGMGSEAVGERFLVSLGLLSLLAEASEEGPVLCVVDDAQWLDPPSAEALLFAARRLEAEPVAFLIAARAGDVKRFEAPGLPELELGALSDSDAEDLLRSHLDGDASPGAVANLLATAAGNPLALLELPAGLTSAQLEGTEAVIGPPRARGAVEERYRQRIAALPEPTRIALLAAAAEELEDAAAVAMAIDRLGGSVGDLDPAIESGLVRFDDAVEFHHPLIRSAAYRSASLEDRARVHEALASAVDDAARSVWHRAAASRGPDDGLAAELEVAGEQAVARAAQASAASAFERAAELSSEATDRAHRLRRAAEVSLEAGRTEVALALAERAGSYDHDPADEAALDMLKATVAGRRGSPVDAFALMRAAGDAVAEVNPDYARTLYLWSFFTSFQGGWAERAVEPTELSLRAIATAGGSAELTRYGLSTVTGARAAVSGDFEDARRLFDDAATAGEALARTPMATMPSFGMLIRGDFASMCEVLERGVAAQRAHGAVIGLAGTMAMLAGSQVFDRRLRAAVSSIDEGLQLSRHFGYENDETGLIALRARVAALRGHDDACRADAEDALRRSLADGVGWATLNARLALAELELGLGNAAEAIVQLDQLDQSVVPPVALVSTPDLVDAALRVGERGRALDAVERFRAWSPVSRAPLVAATLARVQAQVSEDDDEAERLFGEAIERHRGGAAAFEHARTLLAFGEWLRRRRRKTDARVQLRTALDTFEGVGAPHWAERARGELGATGETARKRDASTLDDLTPQELRIAKLVSEGATNRDVAAQLFVSPKTVEYHLRKVFLKLGISSRVELVGGGFGDEVARA